MSLSKQNFLDIFSKIFNRNFFFACSHKAALVTASRNYEKKFLSGSILEKISKKFCLESDILSYMIRANSPKTFGVLKNGTGWKSVGRSRNGQYLFNIIKTVNS